MSIENKIRWQYVLSDFVSTSIAVFLFDIIRYYSLAVPVGFELHDYLLSRNLVLCQLLFPCGMMMLYYLSGFYNNVTLKSRTDELSRTTLTAILGTLVFIFVALINDLSQDRTSDYALFLYLLLLMFVLVYVPRYIITSRTQQKVRCHKLQMPTLVVGYSSLPQRLSEVSAIMSSDDQFNIVSLIDWDNKASTLSGGQIPAYNFEDIVKVCDSMDIKRLVVAPHPNGWEQTIKVINRLLPLDKPIYVMADELPVYLFKTQMLSLTGTPFIDITHTHLPESTVCIKRAFDIALSLMMLALSAIPLAIVAVAIKLDSRGSVFYKQQRLGLHKRPFNIIKLRTMVSQAETGDSPQLSYEGDKRITRIGRVLRKYRIDEIPQFYNVLKGDMSIVGPRPERPYYAARIIDRDPAYTLLYRVRPGITSLGMVKYGYARDVDEMLRRVKYDFIYLENMSISTDLKVIIYTIRTVLKGKGM